MDNFAAEGFSKILLEEVQATSFDESRFTVAEPCSDLRVTAHHAAGCLAVMSMAVTMEEHCLRLEAQVVKVYGALRKRLGQCRFEFDVATPAQAIKALCVNFPGLEKWLIDSEQDGVGYRVRIGKEVVKEEDMTPLVMPFSEKEVFTITPVVVGAGGGDGFGLGQVLIGAALIAASFIPGVGAFAVTAMQTVGASLVLNGVATLISPQPNLDSTSTASSWSRLVFPTSSTPVVRMPCPTACGRLFVGSAVPSSGLDVDQVQV